MNKKTFIRAIEYWVPGDDGTLLEFGGGLFGQARRFEAATCKLCFGRGEGLPGQAWESGHPIMLKSLENASFHRSAAARSEGLTCAIALPVFVGARLSTVVVLFCGDDEAHAGAIELWHNEPEESCDMTLLDGYYGTTGDTFEFLSRSTSFRPGTGLPGLAWKTHAPVFMPDLGRGSGFLRADSALKVGINRGFSVPCSAINGQVYVLAFLSALNTPIARRLDVWQPNASMQMSHRFGFSETPSDPSETAEDQPEIKLAAVDRVFGSGVPTLAGQSILLPVASGNRISAVLALSL